MLSICRGPRAYLSYLCLLARVTRLQGNHLLVECHVEALHLHEFGGDEVLLRSYGVKVHHHALDVALKRILFQLSRGLFALHVHKKFGLVSMDTRVDKLPYLIGCLVGQRRGLIDDLVEPICAGCGNPQTLSS